MMHTTQNKLWQETVHFHGHACSGLAIGFRIGLQAMQILQIAKSSGDEEVVCITENDACGVDAVQYLLSCTFGKGNLIYKPMGKMAMGFYHRNTSESCRFIFKGNLSSDLSKEEKMRHILQTPFEELFDTTPTFFSLPQKARIFQSQPCAQCHELTAEPLLHLRDGRFLCLQCDPIPLQTLLF